jgi:hypothetical protein
MRRRQPALTRRRWLAGARTEEEDPALVAKEANPR